MILVLAGPTASGKSRVAMNLARRFDAVIVNGDAFQVYQELSIATAKPSREEQAGIPHYLYDFVPLTEAYSVYEYQKDLRQILAQMHEKQKNVIIAGGTGLYLRAGLYDYEFPEEKPVDLSVYEAMGEEERYAFLRSIDPESAASTHPHNRIRVLNAIKIYLVTGKRKSELLAEQEHKPIYEDVVFFGLNPERSALFEKTDERVETMFEMGIEEENRRLVEKYGRDARAFRAIGVKEFFPYWDGEATLDEVKETIKSNTRHYAKRQWTFFRNQFDIHWVSGEEEILKELEHGKHL
ncbi:MAG: tRNA (adenosine(37)-N6)-dimethylallyltransferase MiaA [Bacilli bacterium]|nr:tRNA (adenosine(37)-N6)-dimethylallyltransferase MiaA [Bacilli bacterium]